MGGRGSDASWATRKATIYVSGSSSKMLSTEIATEFRGRALDFELLPFSFREYAAAHDIAGLDAVARSTEEELRLEEVFRRYLRDGGFPATFDLPESRSVALLQSYVQRVVARDVIERHNVRQPRVAVLFAQRLLGPTRGSCRSERRQTTSGRWESPLPRRRLATFFRTFRRPTSSLRSTSSRSRSRVDHEPAQGICGRPGACPRGRNRPCGRRGPAPRRRRVPRAAQKDAGDAKGEHRVASHQRARIRGRLCGRRRPFGRALRPLPGLRDVDDAATYEREVRALWEALAESRLREATLIVGRGVDAVLERDGKRIVQVPAWKWLLGGCALRL